MYEVEVKVRADHDAVRERLSELDARPLGTVVQADTYFDAPHRDFASTDEALRIRQVGTIEDVDGAPLDLDSLADADSRLTYKGPLVGSSGKTREEIETSVTNGEDVRTILDRLGFEPAATVQKVRERYDLDGYTVTLDEVADLGEFVEVETEVNEAEIERARKGTFEVLERLGLDSEESIRASYLELLLRG